MNILLVGFGPFPGAPRNPSADLVKRLASRRRPALAATIRTAHIFATAYAAVDNELPKLFADNPDIVLMFGIFVSKWKRATRARYCFQMCADTGRRAASLLWEKRRRAAAARPSPVCSRQREQAECRRACRATPAAMSAITPIGARLRSPGVETFRWSSSFTFRAFASSQVPSESKNTPRRRFAQRLRQPKVC